MNIVEKNHLADCLKRHRVKSACLIMADGGMIVIDFPEGEDEQPN